MNSESESPSDKLGVRPSSAMNYYEEPTFSLLDGLLLVAQNKNLIVKIALAFLLCGFFVAVITPTRSWIVLIWVLISICCKFTNVERSFTD